MAEHSLCSATSFTCILEQSWLRHYKLLPGRRKVGPAPFSKIFLFHPQENETVEVPSVPGGTKNFITHAAHLEISAQISHQAKPLLSLIIFKMSVRYSESYNTEMKGGAALGQVGIALWRTRVVYQNNQYIQAILRHNTLYFAHYYLDGKVFNGRRKPEVSET